MSLARRPWFLLLLFGSLVIASRYPLAPGQLFTFDDVNLAYSIGHFDIRLSQPHPPGYPLFVMEMRTLWWLHFRRVESILFTLSLAGSIAALVLLAMGGDRILGGASGYCAAWLMVLHPVFWHAGVTSALRIQLAIVSVAVATACWRAWNGEARWVLWSAVILGLGAGIRPEAGALLFPLWAASALRAAVPWRERGIALGAMAAAVLLWLVPAMIASGGPVNFVKACLDYLFDQASVSSGLFGASDRRWGATCWRLISWIFSGLLGWTLPAVLAWQRKDGWGLGRERLAFLALWFLPPFVFAILVHLEDPGQSLLMLPVVSLAGGYLMSRALDNTETPVPRWHLTLFVLAALGVGWISDRYHDPLLPVACLFGGYLVCYALDRSGASIARRQILIFAMAAAAAMWIVDLHNPRFVVIALPLAGLAAGLALRIAPAKYAGYPPRSQLMALLLAPALVIQLSLFWFPGWYFKGGATTGLRATGERILADLNSGLALASLNQIKTTLATDDHTLRQVRRLVAERPGKAVVVWEHGLTTWRKVAYYVRGVPVVVLEHKKIVSGTPPVIAVWDGPHLEQRLQGPAPLRVRVPAGARIVWLLNPGMDFYNLARQRFHLTAAEPVYYTDLPMESGSGTVGEYELAW